ncbi:MAG: fatty acid desaturase [Pirellulaceae bacterium]|nr:fatty acid desaturase [Pirellulaceae bacterium]
MSAHASSPNVGQIRAKIHPAARERSLLKGLVLVFSCALLYAGCFLATVLVPYELLRPPLAAVTGLTITFLFLQAHDACHDCLTPHRWLNALLGRLLFLPAWHCYSGWVHGHNHVHHGWTNFLPTDYVWGPLSKADYDRLSPLARAYHRLGRWWPGFGVYYGIDILLGKILWLQPEIRGRKRKLIWLADVLLVALGIVAWGAAIVALARHFQLAASPAWLIFWAQVVPFGVAMWLVGFITYLQHTHPKIAWFKDLGEWNFYNGQVLGTAHIRFPRRINAATHFIMEHTAHHVDPRIPLFALPAAQADLEQAFPHDVHDQVFTIRGFFYTQRVCQLYDFENHRWLNWRGEPTSSRTFQPGQTTDVAKLLATAPSTAPSSQPETQPVAAAG